MARNPSSIFLCAPCTVLHTPPPLTLSPHSICFYVCASVTLREPSSCLLPSVSVNPQLSVPLLSVPLSLCVSSLSMPTSSLSPLSLPFLSVFSYLFLWLH